MRAARKFQRVLSHRGVGSVMNKSLILTPHRKMQREVLRFAGRFAKPMSARPSRRQATAPTGDLRHKEFRRLNNLSSPHPDNGEDTIPGKSGL
jgi:hypothetical protein